MGSGHEVRNKLGGGSERNAQSREPCFTRPTGSELAGTVAQIPKAQKSMPYDF